MGYQLTSLGISVLALLQERPRHGYEILQTILARHADRFVKVRAGSLYHVVDRLTEHKLIRRAATSRYGKRPERVVYEITDAGMEALTDRVRELVAVPAREFPEFVAALAHIGTLDTGTAADAVDDRVGALEARTAEIVALHEAGVTSAAGYAAAFDYLLASLQAELSWLRRFATSLRSGRLPYRQTAGSETERHDGMGR